MIELTVKTLDSKNHSFSVPDDITVRQLKEKIADSVNIPADSQRLIYCGRVLQDDKNLSEYDVNGKVIHLVQRAPPVSNGSGPDRGASSARPSAGGNTRRTPLRLFGPGGNAGNAMYLGAMAFPAEFMDGSGISMQQPLQWVQTRLNLAQNMLRRAALILNRLENHTQESNDSSPENGNSSSEANPDEDVVSNNAPIAAVEIAPAAFLVDNTQISAEAGEPSLEIEIETSTEQQNRESSERETQQPTQGTSDQQPQPDVFVFGSRNDNEGDESNNSRVTRTQALANLLETAADVNNRVRPFMAQYQQLMRDDPAFTDQVAVSTNQCLFTSVSEIMHNLAHAYHALSDIMCDFSQPPPRTLRCRPVVIHHSAVVQTGFPIQVATSFTTGANSSNRGQPNAATARPNGSTASASAPLASTTSSAPTEESAQPQPPQPPQAQPEESPATTQPSASTATPTTQQSASAAVTPPSVTHIGPVSGNGAGFEIFVDVAPGSITIDSVEAAVVTNAPTNTSDANTWQSPPEFVQNLISALAGQFMGATVQQIRFPDQLNTNTSSTGTNTSTAAATTQQSTNGQATAASSNGQTATPSSAQNSQARGNTATHPTTATQTRSTARPHVHHLTPSFRGYRSSNFDPFLPCNSHHIRNNRGRRRERANSLHATNTNVNGNSNSNEPANTRGMPMQASSSISISLSADPIMNLEQQLSRASGSQFPGFPQQIMPIIQALRNASVPTEQSNPQQTINQFLQTMQGGGSNSAATLAQILQSVPGYSYTPGESILTDVFMILAQCLSLLDIIQLGMGRSECLVRARPQLQELVTRRLLNNQPLTISAITQIVDRFNAELRPYYSVFEQTRMREEVDLPASISLYNHSMLPSILNTVMAEDQSTFHRTLIRKCTQYVRQLCALLQYCCLDGVSGLETVLRALVTQMNANVPGVVQEWTMTHSIINFRTFISTLNVPIDDVKRYLVYRMGNPTATSPQPAFTPPLIPPAAEPMDVQESEDELVIQSTPSLTREPPVADVPPTQHINEAIGWQSALPPEWVPIITRDSQRQRRQSSQGPFSDAYLSGMPSKRRKLITSAKPQGNLSQVITESMTTALGAAGMSSGPEVDVIAQRAGQDNTLRTAYREQVRSTLCHNLNSNPDYLPEKYPNTAKYFKKH